MCRLCSLRAEAALAQPRRIPRTLERARATLERMADDSRDEPSEDDFRDMLRDFLAGKPVKIPVDESVKHLTIKEREKLVPAVNAVLTKNREK